MTDPAPRVLRIGIVHSGALIHERLIPPREGVTIGGTAATFTVPDMSGSLPLFLCRKGTYRLMVPASGRGRMAAAGTMTDLIGGQRQPLSGDERGKVVIGGITVLFQFVDAPPMPARMLAGSFRPKLIDEDDPLFLGILSLCGAMAAVMMVYVSTLAPPALVSFDEIEDYFVHGLAAPPPVIEPVEAEEPPEIEPIEVIAATPAEAPAEEPEPVEVIAQKPMSPQERAIADARARQAQRDAVVQRSAILNRIIQNRGEGPSIFDREDTVGQELIGAVQDISGEGAVADLGDAPRGAVSSTGRSSAELDEGVQTTTGPQTVVERGPEIAVTERTAHGVVRPEKPKGAEDVAGQVRAAQQWLNPRIRSCYERRIKEVPSLSGRLVLEVDVVNGRATDPFVSGTIHDDALTLCVEQAASRWQVPGVEEASLELSFALSPVN